MNSNLSYIISTRDRLSFLQITLEKLISELLPDEEIVVVDGNSTDGSKEYLQQLYNAGKIHQFISEPDKNQAHGWNKAMLMAKGVIIKKIIDDDVFCYKAIRECKLFMLQNTSVDAVISNDLSSSLMSYKNIEKHTRMSQFEQWKNGLIPSFTFGDVHLLIRKSSLAYIGLYNPAFIMMDWEYSLRLSYLKANIAYFTGFNALSVAHPHTISSLKNKKTIQEQGNRGCAFYEYKGDSKEINTWSKMKIYVGKRLKAKKVPSSAAEQPGDLNKIYNYYYDYISELNNGGIFTMLHNN